MSLSQEFRLVAACCRWPRSDARNVAIETAASGGVEWARVEMLARRHRVEGLVHDGLTGAAIAVPPQTAAALAREAAAIPAQNMAFVREYLDLQRLLQEEGIDFLFLKGATLSMLAYGSLAIKKARDIDVLVGAENAPRANALLSRSGYSRLGSDDDGIPRGKDRAFRNDATGIVIELLHRPTDNPALLPGLSAKSPRQSVDMGGGVALPTLRKDELFAYLCVHGATHGWSRLKWIADLAALLAQDDEAEVERLYRGAVALGAGRAPAQALLLCATLFGRALAPALEAELNRDRVNRWLAGSAVRAMARDDEFDDSALATVPIHLSQLLLGKGIRFKMKEATRKLVDAPDRRAIAGPLRFLFPLLLLPAWLWRRRRDARVR